ncbi:MAG TPA: kelch repeat-containing protein [Candidatus Dormibacteraeota bacterium]|nr:kelch repeat-containing protein [Candidatus Dormibacteraeota bacterium]
MRILALAVLVVTVCCSGTAEHAGTPTPTPASSSPSALPTPTPSPQPAQRVELSLPVPIEETAAAAANGNLYVMGGFNAAGASLNTVFVFDGAGWQTGPPLALPLDHPAAASLEGSVYIAGGHSNGVDSARLFRLDGGAWTELARMHFARGGHALVAVAGKLYAIGGSTSRGNVAQVEAYDPAVNSWTVVSSLPGPRNHVSGFALNGSACLAGGRSPATPRVDCFDPATGAWSRLPDLPRATSGGGAAAFDDGEVVVAGGQDATETRIVDQLVFYGAGDAWTGGDAMQSPRHGFELVNYEGRAWACGGGSAPGLHPVATCTSLGDPAASNG